MDPELKNILQRLETSVGNLEEGQSNTNKKLDSIDTRLDGMDKRFDDVNKRFDSVDTRFDGVDKRFDGVDTRLDSLENGQVELKELFKHSTTLLIENFTNIRKDLRRSKSDTDTDINLLFRKSEEHERDIAKIKHPLK